MLIAGVPHEGLKRTIFLRSQLCKLRAHTTLRITRDVDGIRPTSWTLTEEALIPTRCWMSDVGHFDSSLSVGFESCFLRSKGFALGAQASRLSTHHQVKPTRATARTTKIPVSIPWKAQKRPSG